MRRIVVPVDHALAMDEPEFTTRLLMLAAVSAWGEVEMNRVDVGSPVLSVDGDGDLVMRVPITYREADDPPCPLCNGEGRL